MLNAVTLVAPGVPDSCAGAWPMTISRMPGAGRPASPMTVVVEYSAAGFDLGFWRRHDRHACLLRWCTGCW